MTTVVNSPGGGDGDSSGVGLILGVILGIALIVLFFVYGLPAMRNQTPQYQQPDIINVTLPPAAPNPAP